MTQLSDEVVERVARAICRVRGYNPDAARPQIYAGAVDCLEWRTFAPDARAAIAAYEAKGDIPTLRGEGD